MLGILKIRMAMRNGYFRAAKMLWIHPSWYGRNGFDLTSQKRKHNKHSQFCSFGALTPNPIKILLIKNVRKLKKEII